MFRLAWTISFSTLPSAHCCGNTLGSHLKKQFRPLKTEYSSSLQDWKTKIQHKLLCFIDYIDITQTSHSVEWGYQSNIANCIRVATRPLMMISRWSRKLLIAGCGLGFAGKPKKKQQQQNPTQARQKTSQPHTATFHTSNSGAQCNGRHRLWDMRHLSGHLPGPITRECVPRRNRWGRGDGRETKQPLQVEGKGALVLSGRTNRVYC